MNDNVETEESGPIQRSIWDTRTRENCRWCLYCKKWLAMGTFSWLPTLDERLKYHQKEYCRKSPTYNPTPDDYE